ncbi:MAG TPA: IS3 family transposase [Acidimicrobiales bacterium]|nr:IS3 family transposase [Acidimicrobiales bacterium]
MPAPRKYDQETRDRAVRMYQDRRRDFPDESALQSRKRVGELLDVSPDTMRGWIERVDIDAGQRPGVPSSVEARIKELERENAELRRANEILKTASAFFGRGGARPPTALIVDYVDAHRDRFGVEPICRVLTEHELAIAPSTYYAHKACPVSRADCDDAHLANAALDVWRANRSLYGADKLATAMRKVGYDLGRDQVARLMSIVGIEGVRRGRHRTVTTVRDRAAARHPDLIRRAWKTPSRPDQWWVADFTYVWTLEGFVYTSFVTDVCSRRILGWRTSSSKATPLVMSALEQALFTRSRADARFTAKGLVFHSDAGSQYTAISFTEALIDAGIAPSIGTVGDALDNALMESTIGLYKTELIDHDRIRSWSGRAEVERDTAAWVHWYNTTRIHHAIGKMAPIEFEQHYRLANPANIDEVA